MTPERQPQQPQLRPADEVQRAHDIVAGCLLDSAMRMSLGPTLVKSLIDMAGVLCWLLRHDHNEDFAEVLDAIEDRMRSGGKVLVDSGRLNYPGPG